MSSPLIEGRRRRRTAMEGVWLGLALGLVLWALVGLGVYALVSGRVP